VLITNPLQLPDVQNIDERYEPLVIGTIITPVEYIGMVTALCIDRRGIPLPSSAVDDQMTLMQFVLPLSEVVVDFHDTLKSVTSGFASFDYHDHGFHPSALVRFVLPLSEVVIDFHDTLRSVTSGFASFDYHDHGFHPSALVRMDILLNGVLVDELSTIVHTSRLEFTARRLTEKLKVMIPRQMVQQQSEGKKKMRSVANIKVPRNTFIDVLKR
ncbi:Uncharacterized protein OBRU01_06143, partial [Operophtera brumata]